MGRNAGKFPYATLVEMPFVVQSAESGSLAVWDLYKQREEIQNEFKETHVLWINTAAIAHLYSAKKPLLTLEDLQGQKALVVGASQVEVAKELGMVPVSTSYPEAYLSLQRGMADSIIATFPVLKSLKMNEVTRYVTVCNLRTSGVYHVMNKEKWDSLPDDVKAVFNELSGDLMAQRIGRGLDMSVNDDLVAFKESRNVIDILPEAELARWREKLSGVGERQIQLLKEKGFPNGQAVLDDAVRLGAEWAEKVPSVINYQ
jgi:TRAP-type C4-dicarboxylate transport system substrate-binding protein